MSAPENEVTGSRSERTLTRMRLAIEGRIGVPPTPSGAADRARQGSAKARRDDALALRVLGSLLATGLSVDRSLSVMAHATRGRWKSAAPRVRASVREGASLSVALNDAVGLSPAVLGLVRSGETSGKLSQGVQRAADLMEESVVSQAALRNAMAYPIVLAVASAVAIILMITLVVPKFGAILRDTGGTLPASTRFLLAVADVARDLFVPACVVLIVALMYHRAQLATPEGKVRWHRWLLTLPVLGEIRRASATGRFCETLGALLEGGVKLPPALAGAGQVAGDDSVRFDCERARERVMSGAALSTALGAADFLTPIAANLLRAGEESGSVAVMSIHAGRLEAQRARELTAMAVRFVEPGLILVFGGAVALIAAALLQALYSVRPVA